MVWIWSITLSMHFGKPKTPIFVPKCYTRLILASKGPYRFFFNQYCNARKFPELKLPFGFQNLPLAYIGPKNKLLLFIWIKTFSNVFTSKAPVYVPKVILDFLVSQKDHLEFVWNKRGFHMFSPELLHLGFNNFSRLLSIIIVSQDHFWI